MRILVAFALALALAAPAEARDIFVNNVAGNDANEGAHPQSFGGGGPVRSIGRALRLAVAGDRVVIANTGEPYRESLTLQAGRHSGTPFNAFTIQGNGAVLDGSAPVPQTAWEHVRDDIYRFQPRRKGHHGLFLDGLPAQRREAQPGGAAPDLEPLEWCYSVGWVYFRTEPGAIPHNYELTHTALRVGVTLYQVRNVVIDSLTIQGFMLDGVNAHDGVFGARLVGLTCRGNGRSGVAVCGASRVSIESCLIGNNGAAQVRVEGYSRTQLAGNDLIENTAPALVHGWGDPQVERDELANPPAEAEPVETAYRQPLGERRE